MILNAYVLYDKDIRVYGAIQFAKDKSIDLKSTYERQAIKEPEKLKGFKGNILYCVGTYDDLTGILTQVEKEVVIDFDSLLLAVLEAGDKSE